MINTPRLSATLMLYLTRHVALHIFSAIGIIVLIVAVIDAAELFRRVSNKEDISSLSVLVMEAIKMPSTLPTLIPFGVLFGLIFSFQKLRSTNEIIIARTNGLSLAKISIAPALFILVLSFFTLSVVDPIASATKKRYLSLEENIFGGNGRNLTVSTEGIWLRDRSSENSLIIHGDGIDAEIFALINPLVYTFDENENLHSRYYPDVLVLQEGYWQINGGHAIGKDGRVTPIEDIKKLNSSLSRRDLTHSNKRPETIPLYELWGYIDVLDQAGLPSLGHTSYLYYQLSLPLILVGMVLIVVRFTLSTTGRVSVGHFMVFSVVLGLLFYFTKDLLYVMGSSGRLPPIVAGFAPGLLMIGIGAVMLIHADEQ
jgi:lipopolysaccharide export system permease protein